MNQQRQPESLGSRIAELRKKSGLTQEQLADQLGLTYQAVSKWENSFCCPDILLLPKLANLLGVSVDSLLGHETLAADRKNATSSWSWPDDQTLRLVLFKGHQLVRQEDGSSEKLSFELHGEALNVISQCSIYCDSIENGAVAGHDIQCGDIDGNVQAGVDIKCGDIYGDVKAGGHISCGDIEGNVQAGGNAVCGDVEGKVTAGGTVQYGKSD